MRLQLLIVLFASLAIISCGEDEASDEMAATGGAATGDNANTGGNANADGTDEGSCESLEDSYELKFTQVITRDDSDEQCPMLSPETFADDGEEDGEEDDSGDITTCVSAFEDDAEAFCSATLRCTTTQADGLTIEYQAVFTVDEDKSLTGVLDLEVNDVYCSYAVAGNLEAK